MLAQVAVLGLNVAAADSQWGGLVGLGSQVGASALLAGYSREHEREADALGQQYLVKAGYPASGMTRLHSLLVSEQKAQPGLLETMFSSHPMSSERLETARRAADTTYATSARAPTQRERLPPWVFAALAALLLALVYAALSFALNRQSDPTFSAILALRVPPELQASPPGPAPERLARLLAAEIATGAITVRDLPDRSLVLAQGDQLFEPGSATVSDSFARLLERIGAAAAKTQGQVLVRGHTDDRPIRSVRFPSNWHLSLARADAAGQLLLPALGDPARLRTEGLADSEPVASNQSADGRARNRRVTLVLGSA